MKEPTWLLQFSKNIFSQTGEDGIIEKILELLPEKDNWCVEFGASDGKFFSNSRNLILSKNYSAVLIEADHLKFKNLQNEYKDYQNVTTINTIVGFDESNNLDYILNKTAIPQNFDFISIDIDGNDYHVWKKMTHYQPKVVVIEFNPTIPNEVRFVQPANYNINQSSSLLSLVELGKEKAYELVSVLRFNAFFVKKEYYHLFDLESNAPEILRKDLSRITYLFVGVDGKIFLRGCCTLPWHGIKIKQSELQVLPRFLRKHRLKYSAFERFAFKIFKMFKKKRAKHQRNS